MISVRRFYYGSVFRMWIIAGTSPQRTMMDFQKKLDTANVILREFSASVMQSLSGKALEPGNNPASLIVETAPTSLLASSGDFS